ncbi:MBL fold metallo-hydrolase [Nocardioides sp. AN3]
MTEQLTVGEFTVTVLRDGEAHLPPSAYPGADFANYPGLLDETGTFPIRIGAHLVQGPSGTFLVDAGGGELSMPFPAELAAGDGLSNPPALLIRSGALPAALAEVGVSPDEIDLVLVTHLHLDHVGWLMKDGQPFFANAIAYYGADDWAELVSGVDANDPARSLLEEAQAAGVLRTYGELDASDLPAGVAIMPVPGHTPGHVVVSLESRGEKLWFTGDLIEHPGQLVDRDIHFMTDVDRQVATDARAELLAQAKSGGVVIAPAHLNSPSFRRIAVDDTWVDAMTDEPQG